MFILNMIGWLGIICKLVLMVYVLIVIIVVRVMKLLVIFGGLKVN